MRNLRGRLTLGVTLVLAVVLLIAGTVVSHRVDRAERNTVDDRLKRTAELSTASAVAAVDQELPDSDRRLDAALSATGTSLRLLLGGTTLLETGAPPAGRPPAGAGRPPRRAPAAAPRPAHVRAAAPPLPDVHHDPARRAPRWQRAAAGHRRA